MTKRFPKKWVAVCTGCFSSGILWAYSRRESRLCDDRPTSSDQQQDAQGPRFVSPGIFHPAWRNLRIFSVVEASTAIYLENSVAEKMEAQITKINRRDEFAQAVKLTHRERRFINFASVEYAGQLYMTPQDFLDSVTEAEPRPRVRRRVLTMEEIEEMRVATPSLRHSNTRFFRTVCSKGIISYTEYLFLLSILTKPASGFQIAFNMFDTDGNKRVDMPEFLVLERIFSLTRLSKQREAQERLAKKGIAVGPEGGGSHLDQAARLLSRAESVPTTLLVHFFGRGGKGELTFDDFKKFMENLQTEVLELEFQEYSRGREVISETDFARILLRYTSFHSNQYDEVLDRLWERMPTETGITFKEFKMFCQFLNNLEDFAIAMKMYTLADRPISQDEFQRAVKICTGETLSRHLVNVVFQIFDEDGDGQLSYKEFIAIMKDRLHRGFHTSGRNEGWQSFKSCMRMEMEKSS